MVLRSDLKQTVPSTLGLNIDSLELKKNQLGPSPAPVESDT